MYSLYPSLVRQQGLRDIGDGIMFLLILLLLDPLVGFGLHLLAVLGWAFTLVFIILAFIVYYRMDFKIKNFGNSAFFVDGLD